MISTATIELMSRIPERFANTGYREISGYGKRIVSIATENQSANIISNVLAGGGLPS